MDLSNCHTVLEVQLLVFVESHVSILDHSSFGSKVWCASVDNLIKIILVLIIKLSQNVVHDVLTLGS